MSIDFHAHLAREDPNAPFFMRDLFDVEGYLEKQERAGIERTVLSFALEDEGETMDEIKGEHDFLAGLLEQYPDRLSALAAVDPFGGADALAEGERALELGFTGFCFPTSRGGRYPDSADAADAFALADEKGALVFLHPSAAPIEPERAGHRLVNAWVGRPYDTGICLSRMLLADTLAGYPNIRMVVAHSGGTLPMLIGRLEHVFAGMKRMAGFAGGGPPGGGPPGGGPPGGGGPPAAGVDPRGAEARRAPTSPRRRRSRASSRDGRSPAGSTVSIWTRPATTRRRSRPRSRPWASIASSSAPTFRRPAILRKPRSTSSTTPACRMRTRRRS